MTKTIQGGGPDLYAGKPPLVISAGKAPSRFNRDWLRCSYPGEDGDTGLIRISEIASVIRTVTVDDSKRVTQRHLAARGVAVTLRSGEIVELTDVIYSEVKQAIMAAEV